VLTKVVPAAQCTDRKFVFARRLPDGEFSLQHGNTDGSSFAYVLLGMIAGPHFDNYKAGFEFGRLGYALVEKTQSASLSGSNIHGIRQFRYAVDETRPHRS